MSNLRSTADLSSNSRQVIVREVILPSQVIVKILTALSWFRFPDPSSHLSLFLDLSPVAGSTFLRTHGSVPQLCCKTFDFTGHVPLGLPRVSQGRVLPHKSRN